jgi:hypothetical protein
MTVAASWSLIREFRFGCRFWFAVGDAQLLVEGIPFSGLSPSSLVEHLRSFTPLFLH